MSFQQSFEGTDDIGLSIIDEERKQYPEQDQISSISEFVQRIKTDQTAQSVKDMMLASREQFLVCYYQKILGQHILILGLMLFGLKNFVGSIFVQHNELQPNLRWTFFLDIALLVVMAVGLPIVNKYPIILRHQQKIFKMQTVLVGFLLIGIGSHKTERNHILSTHFWIIITVLIFILHSIAQIILIKRNATHLNKVLIKFAIFGLIALNYIFAIQVSGLYKSFPIGETIVIYALYYFNQLNKLLLYQVDDLQDEVQQLVQSVIIKQKKQQTYNIDRLQISNTFRKLTWLQINSLLSRLSQQQHLLFC